ncbi:hypothetical protein BS50DRAFT_677419 [Corynespora cassiicola Philippines]|uniref:Uncharacterized protein n=1 Tax=Corynespora cassiicola Philippines TaxID=1448308 RepID=A0A2T2NL37_CORCC|nr:hypothetical protein BS50DRAFT_677419 [Corynespora cassiicola Philippines]
MNWTGGSLQRSKNANKGVVQKQRQHFARVRTQLQHGIPKTSPSRPSHLAEGRLAPAGRLPPVAAASVQHVAHRGRIQDAHGRATPRHSSSGVQNTQNVVIEEGPHALQTRTKRERLFGKRMPNSASLESQSFEEKRQRLLEQDDWVGLAPSRPVKAAIDAHEEKEKDRIGKRRKVRGRGAKGDIESPRRSRLPAVSDRPNPFVLQDDMDNISIRIGTDALTNRTLTRQTDHAQPCPQAAHASDHASAESMLFDDDNLYTVSARKPKHSVDCISLNAIMPTDMPTVMSAQAPATPQQVTVLGRRDNRSDSSSGKAPPSISLPLLVKNAIAPGPRHGVSLKHISPAGGSQTPSITVSTDIHGTSKLQYPRLVPRKSPDCSIEARVVLEGNTIGQPTHERESTNAGLLKSGRGTGDEQGLVNAEKVPVCRPRIVDDGPWKSFLACSNNSSPRSGTGDAPRRSPPHFAERSHKRMITEAGLSAGSQHATLGDQTRISSPSCSSASLPSIRQTQQESRMNGHTREAPRAGARSDRSEAHGLVANEKLWQRFVFGSQDEDMSSQSRGSNVEDGAIPENMKGYATWGVSPPRRQVSCVAVGSVSSTPFRSVSGLTSCVSDDVQDTTARAPPSTSSGSMLPTMALPAVSVGARGLVEATSDLDFGDDELQAAETTGLGEQAGARASMTRDRSLDASWSRIFGDSRAPIGLDRPHGSRNGRAVGPALAKRSERQTHWYHKDEISEDSDDGIELVDADRLM